MFTEKKAVIYARYSCDKQTEQSIEGQVRVIKEFAEREGYVIIGSYYDRAKSAKTANRPEFLKMIQDSAKGLFSFVLVYKLDRFSRNRYDSAFYKQKLRQNGVQVVSATECLSDNPESIITEAMLEAMAEFYSAELSQKTKRGMRESALKCQSTGSAAPIGYKWGEDKKLHINEATAPIPRIIFEMYADGKGKKEICDTLNANGYKTRTGRPFSINSLDSVLVNKKYIGIYTYDGIEIENGCPALIDKAVFDNVQQLIQRTKKAPARARAKVEYLLAGKLFCGNCGAPLIAVGGTSRNGQQHHYYRCKNFKECGKKAERKGFIEWLAADQVTELLNQESRAEILAEKVITAFSSSMESEKIDILERQISAIETKINNVVELLIDRKSDSLLEKLDDLELQKSELQEEINSAKLAAAHTPTKNEIINWFKRLRAAEEENAGCATKQILNTFVHKVFLWNDKALIVLTLGNTEANITFEQIREWEEMAEETQKPLSDFSESGSCKCDTGSPYYQLNEHIILICGKICILTGK